MFERSIMRSQKTKMQLYLNHTGKVRLKYRFRNFHVKKKTQIENSIK